MTADKRNTKVVIALILSLTAGVGILILLEPGTHHLPGSTLLAAERGTPLVDEVEIAYARSLAEARELVDVQGADSICLVYPDQDSFWEPRGPHVQLVVVGSDDGDKLQKQQKENLLAALRALNAASGRELVSVRLAPSLEAGVLPPQAADMRELLVRKRIIE